MRKVVLIVLVWSLGIGPAGGAFANSGLNLDPDLTGREWTQLTHSKQIMYIFLLVRALRDRQVNMRLSYIEYAELLDQYIESHPDTGPEPLSEVFASMVYAAEPNAREDILRLSRASRRQSAEPWGHRPRTRESYYNELGLGDG